MAPGRAGRGGGVRDKWRPVLRASRPARPGGHLARRVAKRSEQWLLSSIIDCTLVGTLPSSAPMKPVVVKLPNGEEFQVENLDTPFCEVLKRCAEILGDRKLTAENFGALNYFFFSNRSN